MLKIHCRHLAAAALCSAIVTSAWAAEPSAAQLYDATIKHVDVGGEYLQYQNFASTQAFLDKLLDAIAACGQDKAEQKQIQSILQSCRSILNLHALQSLAVSSTQLTDGNYCAKEFAYFGENFNQPGIFSLLGKSNHAIQLQTLPADTIAAMEITVDVAAFYPHLLSELQNSSFSAMRDVYQQFRALDQQPNPLIQAFQSFHGVISVYLAGNFPDDLYGEITISDPSGKLVASIQPILNIQANHCMMLPPPAPESLPWLQPVLVCEGNAVKVYSSPERRANPAKLNSKAFFKQPELPSEGNGCFVLQITEAQIRQFADSVQDAAIRRFIEKLAGDVLLAEVFRAEKDGYSVLAQSNFSLPMLTNMNAPATLASLLLPALSAARERARTATCMNNLKQIGLGCTMYADDNKGIMPDTLDNLLERGYLYDAVFHCPSDDASGNSYFYLGKGMTIGKNKPFLPVAFDKPGLHANSVNVLFLDGHVETLSVSDYVHPRQVVETILAGGQTFTPEELKLLETNLEQY